MKQPGHGAHGQGFGDTAFLHCRKMPDIVDPDGQFDEMKRIGCHVPIVACQSGFIQTLFHSTSSLSDIAPT